MKTEKFTDRSVRDFPVSAQRVGNNAEVTLKMGRHIIGRFTVNLEEWLSKTKSANENWNRRELIRDKIKEGKLGDFNSEGAEQVERIVDSVVTAVSKAFNKPTVNRSLGSDITRRL